MSWQDLFILTAVNKKLAPTVKLPPPTNGRPWPKWLIWKNIFLKFRHSFFGIILCRTPSPLVDLACSALMCSHGRWWGSAALQAKFSSFHSSNWSFTTSAVAASVQWQRVRTKKQPPTRLVRPILIQARRAAGEPRLSASSLCCEFAAVVIR
jgi:hypothetical protein